MSFLNEEISINSIIGSGSTIRGDIKINGFVRIDGDIDGNLETIGNVIIGNKARVQGNIIAHSVTIIGGVIKGNITASKSVQVLSSSIVLGDIVAHEIKADDDVIINGHCIALSDDVEFNTAYTNWQNIKTITSHSLLQSVHVSHESSILEKVQLIEPDTVPETESIIEETVQDIVIDQTIDSETETTKPLVEAIPSSDVKEVLDEFIPITLGQKINYPPEENSNQ